MTFFQAFSSWGLSRMLATGLCGPENSFKSGAFAHSLLPSSDVLHLPDNAVSTTASPWRMVGARLTSACVGCSTVASAA
jgi:hypothetical protein